MLLIKAVPRTATTFWERVLPLLLAISATTT